MKIPTLPLRFALTALLLAAPCLLQAQSPSPHTRDASTLLLYHFDETAGGTAGGGTADFANAGSANYSGKGYDIAADQLILGGAGVFDKAVRFAGATAGTPKRNAISALNFASSGEYTGGSFTLEAWIKDPYLTNASATQGRVIAQARDSAITWSFGLKANGGMLAMGNASGGSFSGSTAALSWASDTWYYVALTVNTDGQAAGMALYTFHRMELGGTSLTTVDSFVGAAPVNPGTAGFLIGGNTSSGTTSFGGWIDEVHYSDISRSYAYLAAAAIPEPSTYGLALCAATLLAGRARWRRK